MTTSADFGVLYGQKTTEDALLIYSSYEDLCVGETLFKDKGQILFQIEKLREKRTMIFAQSGFGKTNLVKVLLYQMIGDATYGKLIFDLNGEYFLRGTKTYGLGDVNEPFLKENLVVYSDKTLPDEYTGNKRFIFEGKVLVNMYQHLKVGDILSFSAGFTEVMKSFLVYLDESGVGEFIKNIHQYTSDPSKLYRDFSDFFGEQKIDKKTTHRLGLRPEDEAPAGQLK